MSELHPPILMEGAGVQYDLRLSKKRKLRDTLRRAYRPEQQGRFWALKEIDLRVNAGDSLAVIGANGAGKSTLLQLLAGILEPSEGRVEVRGRITTLLHLGAGFDLDLDARENARLVGAFLGIDSSAMEQQIEPIIEFADLGAFAEAPARTYSSGMRARLGFSIATSIEPDVLLLDEVLSTGDAAFVEKSLGRVMELKRKARAIVYVTHDLETAADFCTRAIEIEKGHIVNSGPSGQVIEAYRRKMAQKGTPTNKA
jgi:ABC-2 type transport system ATP-binding protein